MGQEEAVQWVMVQYSQKSEREIVMTATEEDETGSDRHAVDVFVVSRRR